MMRFRIRRDKKENPWTRIARLRGLSRKIGAQIVPPNSTQFRQWRAEGRK